MMIIHLYSIHYFLTIIYHCLALLMPLTTKVNSLTVITIWQFSRLEKEHNNHNNEQENLLSPMLKHYQKFQTTLTEYNCLDGQTLNYEFLFLTRIRQKLVFFNTFILIS